MLNWSKDLVTGIYRIDSEHQFIILQLNQVKQLFDESSPIDPSSFPSLFKFAVSHILNEEALIAKTGNIMLLRKHEAAYNSFFLHLQKSIKDIEHCKCDQPKCDFIGKLLTYLFKFFPVLMQIDKESFSNVPPDYDISEELKINVSNPATPNNQVSPTFVKEGLNSVMASDVGFYSLLKFLASEYSVENALFLRDVGRYNELLKAGPLDELKKNYLIKMKNEIFNTFISIDAVFPLNVSDTVMQECQNKVNDPNAYENIFNNVISAVARLIENDSMGRFYDSPCYKEYLSKKHKNMPKRFFNYT